MVVQIKRTFGKLYCKLFLGVDGMSNYEKFIWVLAGIASAIMLLVVLTTGGVLTIISMGLALVVYYPLKLADYLLGKFVKENK